MEPHGQIASTAALARHLGLSRWTVSRVLNGHSEVKSETVRRVREAMERLGFVPNPLGRALRGARTGIVGVCFQALGSPIVAHKIAVLQEVLRKAGFRALFEVTSGDPALELQVVQNFLAMHVDGLVLVGGITEANAAHIAGLAAARARPLVLVNPLQAFALPSVELDREQGTRLALEHLLQLGHARIALLGIDEHVLCGRLRSLTLRRIAVERGMDWDAQFLSLSEPAPGGLDFAYGRRLAEKFLHAPARPTALLALNDQVAIGAMARLQQAGLRVPEDVSVVGFDNLEISNHVNPRLTTVDQQVHLLMQSAVELLTTCGPANGHGTGEPPRRVIEPRLVQRESTARFTRVEAAAKVAGLS